MVGSILTRGLAVAALAAAALAYAFYADGKAKAQRITDLEGQVAEQRADAAALRVLASRRPRIELSAADALAAVNAAGETTNNACLTDPRVRAAYDSIERMRDDAGNDAP